MSSAIQNPRLRQMRGEVNFRRFHSLGPDPRTQDYLKLCYDQRRGLFRDLALQGLPLSPFLEIGAETGANSLILANDLRADGIALDISRDALAAMPAYAERLQLDRLPKRVCADAHCLPLRNNSLPLVIVWGTLHHFPHPEPMLAEIRRVLAPGGLLVVGDEPVRRLLSLHLKRTRTLHSLSPIMRTLLRWHLLPWLFDIDGAEAVAAGATEMQFSRRRYKRMLAEFFEQVQMFDLPYITADIRAAGPLGRALLQPLGPTLAPKAEVTLFGGAIGARCRKQPVLSAAWLDDGIARPLIDAPARGMRRFILRKKTSHRSLDILLAEPTDRPLHFRLDDQPAEPVAQTQTDRIRLALSPALVSASLVHLDVNSGEDEVEIDGFVLSAADGGDAYWSAARPPGEIAGEADAALACPRCRTINRRCRADLCGQPCLARAEGTVRIEGNKAVAVSADIPAAAVAACPVGAIDRPSLVRPAGSDAYRCLICGATYPRKSDILTLLDKQVEQELYPNI